jgi:hypothetical protein
MFVFFDRLMLRYENESTDMFVFSNGRKMNGISSSDDAGLFLLTFVEKTVDGCLCGDNGGALAMQGESLRL